MCEDTVEISEIEFYSSMSINRASHVVGTCGSDEASSGSSVASGDISCELSKVDEVEAHALTPEKSIDLYTESSCHVHMSL